MFAKYRDITLKVMGIAVIVYILDAWLISALAALISQPDSVNYYLLHPLTVAWQYLLGIFTSYSPLHNTVFATWKIINLTLVVIAIAIWSQKAKPANLNPIFGSNLLGSAGWATLKDLSKVFSLSLSPGILFGKAAKKPVVLPPIAGGNRNVAVLGPPGSGKSRGYVRNNLFQAVTSGWSVVVTDPKGELTRDFRQFFLDHDYDVKVFNLVEMTHSDRWNPLSSVKTDIDAQLFCETVIANTDVPGKKGGDAFWSRAENNLLKALTLYVINELPPAKRNIGELYKILASGDDKYLDMLFKALDYEHPAKMPYNIYCETSEQVRSGVVIGLGTRLQVFQNELVRGLTETSDISLVAPGRKKCAYFCIISDMNRAFDFLASLYFSFLFIELTSFADRSGGELKIPANFLLDEFCNIGHIPDFTKKISTMRSRAIACSVIFQSITQLKSFYPDNEWETILADCDSWLVLGVKDVTSAKYVSEHLGVGTIETQSLRKPVGNIFTLGDMSIDNRQRNLLNPDEITRLPKNQAILSAFGLKPAKLEKMDFTLHPMNKKLIPRPISDFKPKWSEEYAQRIADGEIEDLLEMIFAEDEKLEDIPLKEDDLDPEDLTNENADYIEPDDVWEEQGEFIDVSYEAEDAQKKAKVDTGGKSGIYPPKNEENPYKKKPKKKKDDPDFW